MGRAEKGDTSDAGRAWAMRANPNDDVVVDFVARVSVADGRGVGGDGAAADAGRTVAAAAGVGVDVGSWDVEGVAATAVGAGAGAGGGVVAGTGAGTGDDGTAGAGNCTRSVAPHRVHLIVCVSPEAAAASMRVPHDPHVTLTIDASEIVPGMPIGALVLHTPLRSRPPHKVYRPLARVK